MRFSLKLEMDNAAFEDDGELPRILARVADQVREGFSARPVMDVNGNEVGEWQIKGYA